MAALRAQAGFALGQLKEASGDKAAARAMAAINALQKRDVPWDGDVYCILPPTAWNQMLINQVFSNSQWSDEKSLAQGVTAKKWNGVNWVLGYEELFATPSGTGKRFFMYHKSAIGGLTNKEMQSRITWENTKTVRPSTVPQPVITPSVQGRPATSGLRWRASMSSSRNDPSSRK